MMRKINFIAIMLLFLYTLPVSANEEYLEYEINPPDITDLRLPYYTTVSEVYGVRPKEWNVRAIVINNNAYEFDKQANVVSVDGKKLFTDGRPVTGYLVELYSKIDNRPVWKGPLPVYYWVNSHQLLSAIPAEDGTLIRYSDKICPAQIISGGYTLDITYSYNDDTQQFLNGDCSKAISKKINGRIYKTYPSSKKIDKNLYWIVQYFSDPIIPIYGQNNKCILYCDTVKKKAVNKK